MTKEGVDDKDDDVLPSTTNAAPSSQNDLKPSDQTNPVSSSNSSDDFLIPSFQILPAAIATLAFVLFWPLLAFFRGNNHYFDVDMFLALKGILENNNPSDYSDSERILELPPLSPAEHLVGAIFGPPHWTEQTTSIILFDILGREGATVYDYWQQQQRVREM